MNNFKIEYVIYPIVIGVCAAWTLTGYLSIGGMLPQNGGDQMQFSRIDNPDPDFNLIAQKNIFNADVSTVKNTLDSVGFVPSPGSMATDQTGAGGTAGSPEFNLVGIIKGGYQSFAIMTYKGESLILRRGIPKKGLLLKKVGKDYVELAREDGSVVKVKLRPEKDDGSDQSTATAPGQPGAMPQSGTPSTDQLTVDRKDITGQLSDMNTIMKSASINPFDRDGKFVGYKLTNIKPDSGLVKLGLTSGDVIVRLNGKDISNPSIFFDALANSENLSAIVLDIERNGVKKTLNVEIKG